MSRISHRGHRGAPAGQGGYSDLFRRLTALPRGRVESNRRRTTRPQDMNSIRPDAVASLLAIGEAQLPRFGNPESSFGCVFSLQPG